MSACLCAYAESPWSKLGGTLGQLLSLILHCWAHHSISAMVLCISSLSRRTSFCHLSALALVLAHSILTVVWKGSWSGALAAWSSSWHPPDQLDILLPSLSWSVHLFLFFATPCVALEDPSSSKLSGSLVKKTISWVVRTLKQWDQLILKSCIFWEPSWSSRAKASLEALYFSAERFILDWNLSIIALAQVFSLWPGPDTCLIL